MRIFLIGYMGSGKSWWGEMIAKHYGFRFIDLDKYIEEREGLSIPEIFEKYKEVGFRKREHEALKSIADITDTIIATGGGAPCFNNSMEEMNCLGETLYIEATPELLCKRITNSETERPLVKNLSQDELLNYIEKHMNERLPFYSKAKHKIVTGNLQLEDFIRLLDPIINSANR